MAPDTAFICRNAPQQLAATVGYTTYLWDANATINDVSSRTPTVLPVSHFTKYYCSANIGSCNARDSINIKWKDLSVVNIANIY